MFVFSNFHKFSEITPFFFTAQYRDVPKLHEIEAMGNFMPRVAENAEELINYALSHIPASMFQNEFSILYLSLS